MSGGISAGVVALAGTVVSAGAAIYGAQQTKKQADEALKFQKKQADDAKANAPQASKSPNYDASRAKASNALAGAGAGNSSTFLTGASGVDDAMLNLGKSTFLGQ